MNRALIGVIAVAIASGCVGQDDVDGRAAALARGDARDVGPLVPETAWRPAAACGDTLPEGVVRPVAGEVGLGAIVGAAGRVQCVDVWARLSEIEPVAIADVDGEEPNPQPMTDGSHGEEPNPQPMTQGTRTAEPNPQPMLRLGVEGEGIDGRPIPSLFDAEEPNPQPM